MRPILPWLLGLKAALAAAAAAAAPDPRPKPASLILMGCPEAVAHVPEPGTRHVPGIDVRGEPVAPPDLEPRLVPALPPVIAFPAEINPVAEAGLSFPTPTGSERFEEATTAIGTLEVDLLSGALSMDGTPLLRPPACPR